MPRSTGGRASSRARKRKCRNGRWLAGTLAQSWLSHYSITKYRSSITKNAPKALLVLLSSLALTLSSWGQKNSFWRIYNLADGMPESACISVTAAQQGRVLVRHVTQPFISELDGYGINPVPAPNNAVGRVYESPGG